ncbi:hypothetical protein C2845_PM01G21660 [Panicum miliaceum]|uniref:Uncharacterized protein n=1 Tax=Panicum miliaceum TaxID=4540 RepID=A0A3L6TLM9_PANMI|nr:hypothetical protein C2845_PM01G21660 [Panicum miliaceum]
MQQVLKDMAALELSELGKMANVVRASATDLRFLTRAYKQIASCRRVLRWAYVYGYFLDPVRDAAKRGLFDHLQSDANRLLERLHGCAEGERKQLCATAKGASPADIAERYRSYKKKPRGRGRDRRDQGGGGWAGSRRGKAGGGGDT